MASYDQGLTSPTRFVAPIRLVTHDRVTVTRPLFLPSTQLLHHLRAFVELRRLHSHRNGNDIVGIDDATLRRRWLLCLLVAFRLDGLVVVVRHYHSLIRVTMREVQ